MYLRSTSFDTIVAFLSGYDLSSGGGLLVGFREWLVLRLGHSNNLVWWELALDVIRLNGTTLDDQSSVHSLFALLDEFLREKAGGRDALAKIFVAHHEWLRRQTADSA